MRPEDGSDSGSGLTRRTSATSVQGDQLVRFMHLREQNRLSDRRGWYVCWHQSHDRGESRCSLGSHSPHHFGTWPRTGRVRQIITLQLWHRVMSYRVRDLPTSAPPGVSATTRGCWRSARVTSFSGWVYQAHVSVVGWDRCVSSALAMPTERLPRRRLQSRCAALRLSGWSVPPSETGTRWSAVVAPGCPQRWQMPASRRTMRVVVLRQGRLPPLRRGGIVSPFLRKLQP